MRKNLLAAILVLCHHLSTGQVEIKGTIFDRTMLNPLQAVSVMGTSGIGTITDSLGHYHIELPAGDSIYFSYLGKYTSKFPVKDISPDEPFDMSLEQDVHLLPTVFVATKDYHTDSLANRDEYRKAFNYSGQSYLSNMKEHARGGAGIGLSLDMIFDAKANRRMEALQQRLEQEEQDKYIDHRFSKGIVKRITGLQPPALDSFMRIYRPSYEFVKSFETDLDFYKYIFDCGKFYADIWKEDHPN